MVIEQSAGGDNHDPVPCCVFAGGGRAGMLKTCTDAKPDVQVMAQQQPAAHAHEPQDTVQEIIATMHQVADTLERIQDAASADAAISAITASGEKMATLREKIKEHPPAKEAGAKAAEKPEAELGAAYYRIKDATIKAVQKAPDKAERIARALADAGMLHAGLDLFDVHEGTYPGGVRGNQLLTLDRTLIGQNFTAPAELRRLATTYYHRRGPLGVVLERWNWFPGPANTYWADARLPASLVALAASP